MKKNLALISLLYILMTLSACKTSALDNKNISLENQEWTLIEINGVSTKNELSPEAKPYINFSPDKKVSGYSGCNLFNGNYEINAENKILIKNIMSTRRACLGTDIEGRLFNAIKTTTSFIIDKKELILKDKNESCIAKFEASTKQNNEKSK